MEHTPESPAQDPFGAPAAPAQPPPPPMFPPAAFFPAPPPPPPTATTPRPMARRLGRAALVVGAAAGLAVGGTALANAATSPSNPLSADTTASSGSSTTPTPPAAPEHGYGPFGGGRFGGLGGPGGPVLYGQFTVQGPNGVETLAERTGTVSDITNTSGSTWSITVKSSDGTSATFVVDSGTSVNGGETGISSVKQNDTVRVLALVSGGTSTAKQLTDETVLQANGNTWMPHPPQPGSDGGTSSSTQTPT